MRGWRKWSVTVLGIVAVTGLALLERLDASAATAIASMVGAFCAANFGVHRQQGG